MAIAFVTSVSAASSDGNSVTTAATNTTGATLLIVFASSLTNTSGTISDSLSNTWTALTQRNISARGSLQGWYCANPTVGSSQTFTITNTGNRPSIAVLAFSGTAASPFDAQTGLASAASVTSLQPGSLTPGAAGEVLVAGWMAYTATSALAIDSSFTLQEHTTRSATAEDVAAAYLIQTSAVAENPTWSWTSSSFAATELVAFTASGSGGETISAADTWDDWVAGGTISAGRTLSAASTLPDFIMSASAQAGRNLSGATNWPDFTSSISAQAGRNLTAAVVWPAWFMSATLVDSNAGPVGSIIPLWRRRRR